MSGGQERARELFNNGGFVIILDAPSGFTLSMDGILTVEVGPLFRGLKMVPSGIHHLSYSLSHGASGGTAMKNSLLIHIETGKVEAFKWNSQSEMLNPLPNYEGVFERNILDMDPYLGPFPCGPQYEQAWRRFQSWSTHITPGTMAGSLQIDIRDYARKLDPPTRTLFMMDHTPLLNELLCSLKPDSWPTEESAVMELKIIGTIQMNFINTILGDSYESFSQWLQLVTLLCNSPASYDLHPEMYEAFFRMIHIQMDEDLFSVDDLHLFKLLSLPLLHFVNNADCSGVRKEAIRSILKLKSQFGFDVSKLGLDDDFDGATIVNE